MVKAKPFEVQTQHAWYSFNYYVNREIVSKLNSWKFFRYKTLMSIKWFESLYCENEYSTHFYPMLCEIDDLCIK